MNTIKQLFFNVAKPQNRKAFYILLTLIALAVASGAPGASSGLGT